MSDKCINDVMLSKKVAPPSHKLLTYVDCRKKLQVMEVIKTAITNRTAPIRTAMIPIAQPGKTNDVAPADM